MTGPFPSNLPSDTDTYTGHVNGKTMALRVTNASHATLASYTLTLGVHDQVVVGTCP